MSNWLSDCHNAPVKVVGGSEGTNHWECTKCGKSCNAAPKTDVAELSREIFPDTTSIYKAFIDRMPTPAKAPNGGSYLEYSATLIAVKEASDYAKKNAKIKLEKLLSNQAKELLNKVGDSLPSQSKYRTPDAYKRAVRHKLSEVRRDYE